MKTLLSLALAICLLSPALIALQLPQDIQSAYDSKQYDKVIQLGEQLAKKDKRNAELFYVLGMSYLRKHDLKNAEANLTAAVGIKGKFLDARYQLGRLHLDNGNLQAAKEQFDQGLKNAKKDVEIAQFEDGLGLYYIKAKDFTQADIHLRRAQIKDPDNYEYYMHQADASFEQGSYAVAISAYKKVLEKDSINADVYSHLAKSYLQQKSFKEALEAINKTLALDSSNADAYLEAGHIYTLSAAGAKDNAETRLKLYNSAIQMYDGYLRLTGDSGLVNYYRGRAYMEWGQYDSASADFESALRANLNKPDLPLLLGSSYMRQKQYAQAIESFNRYEKSVQSGNPDYQWTQDDAKLFMDRARAYSGLADSASRMLADQDYRRALGLDSSDAGWYSEAGLNLYFLKDYNGALAYFLKRIEKQPEVYNTYLNAAYCYLGLKDNDKVIEYINLALERNPQYTGAFDLLAKVYIDKKDYASAIQQYEKAKQVDTADCMPDRWIGLCFLLMNPPQPKKALNNLLPYFDCLTRSGKSICDDQEAIVWVVQAYMGLQEAGRKGAMEWIEKGLKCNPNSPELKNLREKLEESEY